jgi:hypothetical protein
MSAVTLGIGMASVLGAVAIGVTLPRPVTEEATKTANIVVAAAGTSGDAMAEVVWYPSLITVVPVTTNGRRAVSSGSSR